MSTCTKAVLVLSHATIAFCAVIGWHWLTTLTTTMGAIILLVRLMTSIYISYGMHLQSYVFKGPILHPFSRLSISALQD